MAKQRGWVYIDSLLGMVIIALALSALVIAYRQATMATGAASGRTHAVYLAQQALEELKQYDGQAAVVLPPQQKVVQDGITYIIQASAINVATINSVNGLGSKLKPVNVTVTWQQPGSNIETQSVSMTNYYYVK